MTNEKVVIVCPDCGTSLRFPILENPIRFKCTQCRKPFEAVNGRVINPDVESTTDMREKKKFELFTLPHISQLNWWRFAAVIFLIMAITFYFNLRAVQSDRTMKNELTERFISTLHRNHQKKDFSETKRYLTKETAELFSTFIESQYLYKDSSESIKIIKNFFNTITPLNYEERRKFMYRSLDGDTSFFDVNFIKYKNQYLLDVQIDEFIK